MEINDLVRVVVAFFAIIDPIGSLLIYHLLTNRLNRREQLMIALTSNGVAFLVLAVFAVTGTGVLHYLQISLPSFEIAAGVLLIPSAFRLVEHGQPLSPTRTAEDVPALQLAVVPLAIPLLAGPGALATAISFTPLFGRGTVIAAAGIDFAASAAIFAAGGIILKLLGAPVLRLLSRLIGILLMAIAINLIVSGIQQVLR